MTALHLAVEHRDLQIVELLIEKMSAKAINQGDRCDFSSLILAMQSDEHEIIKLLIGIG